MRAVQIREFGGPDVLELVDDAPVPEVGDGEVLIKVSRAGNGIATKEQNEVRTGRLLRKSWSVVGFWLMHCLGRRDLLEEPLADLFERAARGELRAQLGTTYPLSQVRRAHAELAGRRTQGKLLLDPSS